MKAHFLLISIILSIITCSCKNKANSASTVTVDETITLSPQKIDLTDVEYSETPQLLSDFVDSIEYIQLSDQPLIPDTRKVRLSEDVQGNLYLDFNEIYKYTPRGKYLKSLFKQGQGPGEIYAKYIPGIYNKAENYVLVKNHNAPYNKYTLEGNFIKTVDAQIDSTNIEVLTYWKNYEIFRYEKDIILQKGEAANLDSAYFCQVKDKTGKIIYRLPNHHFDIKATSPGRGTIVLLGGVIDYGEINRNLFWIRPNYVDTVYSTSDWTDVRPYYIIQRNNRAADYAWSVRMKVGDITREDAEREQLCNVYALKSGLLFNYLFNPKQQGAGFCPANGKSKTISRLFKNDIDSYCPSIDLWQAIAYKTLYQKEDYLYLLIDAFKFFEEGAKSPFPDLTEESNPVLVKLKLK